MKPPECPYCGKIVQLMKEQTRYCLRCYSTIEDSKRVMLPSVHFGRVPNYPCTFCGSYQTTKRKESMELHKTMFAKSVQS